MNLLPIRSSIVDGMGLQSMEQRSTETKNRMPKSALSLSKGIVATLLSTLLEANKGTARRLLNKKTIPV